MSKLSFKLEVTNENLTSHAGLVLVGELMEKLSVTKMLDKNFPSPQSNNGYHASSYVIPLLLKMHGGGNHIEDVREIKNDKVITKLLCLDKIPTTAAIGVWLRRYGRDKGQRIMHKINRKILHKALRLEDRKEYTLDIDATEIISNKRNALYTYKKNKGYMPMVGHLAENGMIIGADFRSGNISPSTKNYEFIKSCISNMVKGKVITNIRADSAAYQSKIFNYCNNQGIYFTIGGTLDSSTLKSISRIKESEWEVFEDGEIAGTSHFTADAESDFRLIVKRKIIVNDLLGKEYLYHVIVSNRPNESPIDTMTWYNQRGETSENRIKELKSGFNLNTLPCGQHNANALYFYIGCLAYNLSIILKNHILPSSYKKHKISTLRWKLYQVAGKLIKKGRRIYLKIREDHLSLFKDIRHRCRDICFT